MARPFSYISLYIFIFITLSFLLKGLTTLPAEGDSLAYHIPIAQSILDGSIVAPSHIHGSLGFYPGSGELILAIFMLLHIPLNLFNVIGWILLAYTCYKLGTRYSLSQSLSTLFAVSTISSLAYIQLLPNQTIDIWLAVFFTWTLILLKRPHTSMQYFLQLGLSLGLLIGSKYTGPVYAAILLAFFSNSLKGHWNVKNLLVSSIPVVVLGFSWYIRNFLITSNPVYPQHLLFLKGDPEFHLLEWTGWKTIFLTQKGAWDMLQALFIEYLLSSFSIVVGAVYIFLTFTGRIKKNSRILVLACIGILNFLLFFFMPSTSNNIVTYMRYLFPAIIPLSLACFLVAKEYKKEVLIGYLALINAGFILTQLPYQPKLFAIFLILIGSIAWKAKR